MKCPRLTFGGEAGVGKSLCEQLAERLQVPYFTSGGLYRKSAAERKLTPEQLGSNIELSAIVDHDVDERTKKIGRSGEPFVLESRLGHLLIPDSFKILLVCRFEVRIVRIAGREGISVKDAARKTIAREDADQKRFRELYGYDNYLDPKLFDKVFDTSDLSKIRQVEELEAFINGVP